MPGQAQWGGGGGEKGPEGSGAALHDVPHSKFSEASPSQAGKGKVSYLQAARNGKAPAGFTEQNLSCL